MLHEPPKHFAWGRWVYDGPILHTIVVVPWLLLVRMVVPGSKSVENHCRNLIIAQRHTKAWQVSDLQAQNAPCLTQNIFWWGSAGQTHLNVGIMSSTWETCCLWEQTATRPITCKEKIKHAEEKHDSKYLNLYRPQPTIIINYFNWLWLLLLLKYFQTVPKAKCNHT